MTTCLEALYDLRKENAGLKQQRDKAAAELEALQAAIKLIEADAIACEQEAAKFKAKNDGINAYLMSTQAMAHRLDLKRLKP